MARFFNSSNHTSIGTISCGSAIAGIAYPFTVAAWFRPIGSAIGSGVADVIVSSSVTAAPGSPNKDFGIYIDDSTSALNLFVVNHTGGYNIVAPTGTSIRDGAWHTGAIVGRSNTDRTYFADASSSNSTASFPRDTFGNSADEVQFGIYAAGSGGKSHVAELSIWSIDLTNNELAAYRAGVRPQLIRPANLVGYWPLAGLASPEPDFSGSRNNVTLSGTPVAADHPPVSLRTPRRAQVAPYDEAAGGGFHSRYYYDMPAGNRMGA